MDEGIPILFQQGPVNVLKHETELTLREGERDCIMEISCKVREAGPII
jgi:hypothetical protein